MANFTNKAGISLAMAVWLASDEYDGTANGNKYFISATGLLQSIRRTVLTRRLDPNSLAMDIMDRAASRLGTAIHDAVERSWKVSPEKLASVLVSLGYPEHIAKRVVVNPPMRLPNEIPVYIERRSTKQVGRWVVSGKFDMVMDGDLSDIKTTKVYGYINKTKIDDYVKQGSLYKWLNPDIITGDNVNIDYYFTDWKEFEYTANPKNYPASQLLNEAYPLMPIAQTDAWVRGRLNLIDTYELADEKAIPHCTDEELWRQPSKWKYYKGGVVTARSTRTVETAAEAYALKTKDGNTGLVVEVKSSPTACKWCPAFSICTQKDAYLASGELSIT